MIPSLTVDFCSEIYPVDPTRGFTIGREADLILDEANPFLHRVFLRVEWDSGLWWLRNVGSALSATVSSNQGEMQAWLSPMGQLPLVFPFVCVWFTAAETTYEFEIHIEDTPWETVDVEQAASGELTIGTLTLSVEQRILVAALAEDVLRHQNRGAGTIPTSAQAAARLGWSVTKLNRKLDYLCGKLADMGVRGLHGGPGRLATSRKARLVEYCLGIQMVTVDDLSLLPTSPIVPVDQEQ
ncbi:MAG: hypothetical protein LBV06_01320 [Propionibacteriaceae bacterium]|jgi:hypothetical protein|nr:hypothetical protein [Propionibacteriaceae bacterium]